VQTAESAEAAKKRESQSHTAYAVYNPVDIWVERVQARDNVGSRRGEQNGRHIGDDGDRRAIFGGGGTAYGHSGIAGNAEKLQARQTEQDDKIPQGAVRQPQTFGGLAGA